MIVTVDKEELRPLNISKKELNDLINALYDNLVGVDFDQVKFLKHVQ